MGISAQLHFEKMTGTLWLLLLIVTFGAAVETDYEYEEDYNEDYDYASGNYAYDETYDQDYVTEEELDYFPEMITRPQKLVADLGTDINLPCEANVRDYSTQSIRHGHGVCKTIFMSARCGRA